MIRPFLQFALFVVGVGVFTSCKTAFRISVQEPAVIDIPAETKAFAVVNSVTKANSPEQVVGTVLSGGSINGNVVAGERAVDGILRALDNSGNLSGVIYQSTALKTDAGEINWDFMDSVGAALKVHGFIEIEEVRTIAPVGGAVAANLQGQSSSKLDGTAYVNFYILDGRISHERRAVREVYRIPTSGSTDLISILSDMNRKREYYRALGFELGYDAGKLIYPNWVWVNRKYYNKGSKELKRARPMIQKGNWDIAEKQLLIALENKGTNKVQKRANYNLALVNEGQGELEEAIKYAEIAALNYGDKLANEYLVILRQRQRQIELIKAQNE